MEISRNVNTKLADRVTSLERKCYENEQYSRRECIEISGIPQSVEQTDLEKTILNVSEKVDAAVDPQNIEACHRLKSDDNGWSNKVVVKFNTCKDNLSSQKKCPIFVNFKFSKKIRYSVIF